MMLTSSQQNALIELVNIATGRTAGSLSQLTGEHVILDVPQITICPIGALPAALGTLIKDEAARVHQIFSGPVAGDAFLLLDYETAITLVDLMTNEPIPSRRLNASAREVLTEVGNILLNACLRLFGDLLQVRMTCSVPRLHLDTLADLSTLTSVERAEPQYGLVIQTDFQLRDNAVSGYLVFVLGAASLDRLIQAIERTA